MRTPRIVALLLAAAALATVAVPPPARAQGDTSAVATNTRDGSDVFRLAFQIRRVMGDTVDQQNAAVAYASCNACQTTAISIQVLLIGGDPSTFTPGNYAIAINQDCSFCDTLASAYQFAVGDGTLLHFTADGNRRIAEIRRELQGLRNSGLSGPDEQARVDALMNELADVLQNETVPTGQGAGPHAAGSDTGSGGGAPPSGSSPARTATTPAPAASPPAATTPTDTTPTDTTPTGTTPTDTTSTSTTPDPSATQPDTGTTTTAP